ncbi:MAG TPA: HAMP domain-containing sensor histidine kinase [Verrucomicrobiae bacterium]|nr:HAMP domain-containing sensor histidine kinase [Verrucomicrobiae bacterium]
MNPLRNFNLSRPASGWLIGLLLLAAFAPSACVVWFMNEAVHNERLAARQEMLEAQREHLALARSRLDELWSKLAAEHFLTNTTGAPAAFANVVRTGAADSVILLAPSGKPLYPALIPVATRASRTSAWDQAEREESVSPQRAAELFGNIAAAAGSTNLAAEALQAELRCLFQAHHTNEALALAQTLQTRFAAATDDQGRLIAPNAALLALQARPESTNRFDLRRQLENYGPMPASQRAFLMRQWSGLFPKDQPFATLHGEELAARYLDGGGELHPETGLRLSKAAGIWALRTADGNALLLFDPALLPSRLQSQLRGEPSPAGAQFLALAPGEKATNVASFVEAGAMLPDWHLAVAVRDQHILETAAQAQIAFYIWVSIASIGSVAIVAALAVGLIRRQSAFAQLRNDLVANVTHELKTPLSSMRLLVETLLQSDPIPEPTAREYLQLIARENLRLSRLIDNFLTFSRIERNKYAFDFSTVSPRQIADAAANAMRERFQAPACQFTMDVPGRLPPVVADADAMVTALLNLLENAYKYSGDAKEISLTADTRNDGVSFVVKDNGIGLSPRETKRIFQRFYRVNQPARHAGGCGLGLSIVQFIVKAHHGAVRVESEIGRGSSFIITLPTAPATEAAR